MAASEFTHNKWYYAVYQGGTLAGAIKFEIVEHTQSVYGIVEYDYTYSVIFQKDPWSEKVFLPTEPTSIEEALHLAKKFIKETDQIVGIAEIDPAFRLDQLRVELFLIFYHYLEDRVRFRVEKRMKEMSRLMREQPEKMGLAALHDVAIREGYEDELAKWERGFYSWYPE